MTTSLLPPFLSHPLFLSSALSLILVFLLACDAPEAAEVVPVPAEPSAPAAEAVRTGADVWAARGFEELRGLRVGLVVNHTARVGDDHLIDRIAAADGVTLTALFGPEHGLRGTADAGAKVADGVDDATGVPVYSLYGETRRPTAEALAGVDVLVFDIQDVGARFYTYISTMGYAMQAAAANGLPFVVLDRPNPLGGRTTAGFLMEPDHASFVGLYPIPVAHGMTVGELARMIAGEGWLPGLDGLDLRVVEMEGWNRGDLWPETGLPWIPPSPNVPSVEAAFVYAGTCLFEATAASEGRGTQEPFQLLGAPWADGEALAATLNAYELPGARFEPAAFTPESIPGMSTSPKLEGEPLEGVRIAVTDVESFRPVATGIYVLHAFYHAAPDADAFLARPDWLAKLSGTDALRTMLADGAEPAAIVEAWAEAIDAWREARAPYLLY